MREIMLSSVASWAARRQGALSGARSPLDCDLPCSGPLVGDREANLLVELVEGLLAVGSGRADRVLRLGLRHRPCAHGPDRWVVFVEDDGPNLPPSGAASQLERGPWARGEVAARALGGGLQVERAGRVGHTGVVAWATFVGGLQFHADRGPVPSSLAGLSVLVVDDNRVNLAVLDGLLRRWGCRVTAAEDGQQATQLCARHTFDLVLMDLQMPVMDGYTATRWIRSQPSPLSSVPVVAVSANAMPEDRARSAAAGVDAHVAKPVHAGRLEKLLKQVLRQRAQLSVARQR